MAGESRNQNFVISPLLYLAVGFSAGIVVASMNSPPFAFTSVAIVCLAIFAVFFRNNTIGTYLLVLVFFALGIFSFGLETVSVPENSLRRLYDGRNLSSGDPIEMEGVLARPPEPAPDGSLLLVKADSIVSKNTSQAVSGNVRIFVPLESRDSNEDFAALRLTYKSRIRIACLLEREDRFLNPGVYPRKLLLDRQQIDGTANLKSPLLIEKLTDAGPADSLVGAILQLRIDAILRIRETFSSETAGVLIASMFGNNRFLDKRTADIFREGGTFHVLVISGLHITFVGGLLLLIIRRFARNRLVQALITLSILWFYGFAVGGEVPVIRACVMFSLMMLAYAYYRTANLLNALGGSALLLLAWRPSDLFDPSFQLTFVSVAAIIAVALPLIANLRSIGAWMPSARHPFPPTVSSWLRKFCETIYWNKTAWEIEQGRQIWTAKINKKPFFDRLPERGLQNALIFIFEGTLVSIAVQICLLPLLVYYFHRFPLISIPLNLWVGVVLAIESFAAVATLLVSSISTALATPLVVLTEVVGWVLVNGQLVFTTTIGDGFRIPIYSGWARAIYFLYFVPLVIGIFALNKWDPFAARVSKTPRTFLNIGLPVFGTVSVLVLIILFHPFSRPTPDGKLNVEFLDVGQGDSTLITFPNGKTMLIDAGGRPDYKQNEDEENAFEPDVPRIGEAVVSEFLWERGISHIDMIVATHADADHSQGLSDVARNFSLNRAFFGRLDNNDPELSTLKLELENAEVPMIVVRSGDSFEVGGAKVEILNPFDDARSVNDDSLVIRISYGDTSFLFTGDIERQAEAELAAANIPFVADVVKVPHHGSRSSSTEAFVNKVSPKYAVISVGRQSIFGHPHKEVVERWRSIGAEVMTTGERGTITFTSDGQYIAVSRYQQ